jgi:F0F1-type ATP synthase assembly protein I
MEPVDPRSERPSQPPPEHDPARFGAKPRSTASVAAGAGIQFAVSIVVFLYLGQWLDRRLGTAPVFLLGCVFVGAGASFYSMYRQLMAAQRRDAERRAARKAAGGR